MGLLRIPCPQRGQGQVKVTHHSSPKTGAQDPHQIIWSTGTMNPRLTVPSISPEATLPQSLPTLCHQHPSQNLCEFCALGYSLTPHPSSPLALPAQSHANPISVIPTCRSGITLNLSTFFLPPSPLGAIFLVLSHNFTVFWRIRPHPTHPTLIRRRP